MIKKESIKHIRSSMPYRFFFVENGTFLKVQDI